MAGPKFPEDLLEELVGLVVLQDQHIRESSSRPTHYARQKAERGLTRTPTNLAAWLDARKKEGS